MNLDKGSWRILNDLLLPFPVSLNKHFLFNFFRFHFWCDVVCFEIFLQSFKIIAVVFELRKIFQFICIFYNFQTFGKQWKNRFLRKVKKVEHGKFFFLKSTVTVFQFRYCVKDFLIQVLSQKNYFRFLIIFISLQYSWTSFHSNCWQC